MSEVIKAIDVTEGRRVSAIHYHRTPVEHLRKRFGRYPMVIEADHRKAGCLAREDGQPTVYMVLSDDRRAHFCLAPDEMVTVEGGAR